MDGEQFRDELERKRLEDYKKFSENFGGVFAAGEENLMPGVQRGGLFANRDQMFAGFNVQNEEQKEKKKPEGIDTGYKKHDNLELEQKLSEDKELARYDRVIKEQNDKLLGNEKKDDEKELTSEEIITEINAHIRSTKEKTRTATVNAKADFVRKLDIPKQEERQNISRELRDIYQLIDEYSSINSLTSDYTEDGKMARFFKSIWHWGTGRNKVRREEKALRLAKRKIIALLGKENTDEQTRAKLTGMLELIDQKNCMVKGDTPEEKLRNKWGDNVDVRDYTSKKYSFNYVGSFIEHLGAKLVSRHTETRKNDTLLFAHEPCIQDICQGAMGDCYFLTALADIVMQQGGADKIRDMMLDNGDGSVTVRFFQKTGVNVFSPTYIKVDKRVLKLGANDTLWVQIMEKAYAAFVQSSAKKNDKGKILMPNINYSARQKKLDKRAKQRDKQITKLMNSGMTKEEAIKQVGELKEDEKDQYISVDNDTIEFGFIGNGGQINEAISALTGEGGLLEETSEMKEKLYSFDATLEAAYKLGSQTEKSRAYLKSSEERLNKRIIELRQDMQSQNKKEDEFYKAKLERLKEQQNKLNELKGKFEGIKDCKKINDRFSQYTEIEKNGKKEKTMRLHGLEGDYSMYADNHLTILEGRFKVAANKAISLVKGGNKKYEKEIRDFKEMSDGDYKEFIEDVMSRLDDEAFFSKIVDDEFMKDIGGYYEVLCENWGGDHVGDKSEWLTLNKMKEINENGKNMTMVPRDSEAEEKIKKHIKTEIKAYLQQISDGISSVIKNHSTAFTGDYSPAELEAFDDLEMKVKNGEYVGAGSTTYDEAGVYGGHAYSVTDVYRRGKLLFVELRNPHGIGFAQYKSKKGSVQRDFNNDIGGEGVMILEYQDYLESFEHTHSNRKKLA